jgi:hypothetical protein
MLKCGCGNLSVNPMKLPVRMDCRIKSGNDEGEKDDQEKRKRNADRRVQPTSASRDAARALVSFPSPACGGGLGRGHARLSAFHHGSYRQGFRPLGATPGQASWDVAGRSILYGRSNRGAETSRSYTGVTRARLSQSRERTSRTGRSAGQMMPEAARERNVSFRPRAPHSLHLQEYPRPKASFTERDSFRTYLKRGRKSMKMRHATARAVLPDDGSAALLGP